MVPFEFFVADLPPRIIELHNMTVSLYHPATISFGVIYNGYVNIYFLTIAGSLNIPPSSNVMVNGWASITKSINVTDERDVIIDVQIRTGETSLVSQEIHITVQGWYCWCLIIFV